MLLLKCEFKVKVKQYKAVKDASFNFPIGGKVQSDQRHSDQSSTPTPLIIAVLCGQDFLKLSCHLVISKVKTESY